MAYEFFNTPSSFQRAYAILDDRLAELKGMGVFSYDVTTMDLLGSEENGDKIAAVLFVREPQHFTTFPKYLDGLRVFVRQLPSRRLLRAPTNQ